MKPHKIGPQEPIVSGCDYDVIPFSCDSGIGGASSGRQYVKLAKRPTYCPICGAKLTPDNCEGYHENPQAIY